ncbi:[acyl-carrier-protein] S-malonyltransferase [[Candida] zeylanoides]
MRTCALDVLGQAFTDNLFGSQTKWLQATSNAQPAILTTSYCIYLILRRKFGLDLMHHPKVKYVLGHSLGEYSALVINGQLDFAFALQLVATRGRLMEEFVGNGQYAMKAVLFRSSAFETLVHESAQAGLLANINSRNQIVLSGLERDIDSFVSANRKAKRVLKVVTLPVRVPFHNKILSTIEPALYQMCAANTNRIHQGKIPMISNLTGKPAEDAIANTLSANNKPVQWVSSMDFLVKNGVTNVVNLGPGSILQGINSKWAVSNHSVDSPEEMQLLVDYLKTTE